MRFVEGGLHLIHGSLALLGSLRNVLAKLSSLPAHKSNFTAKACHIVSQHPHGHPPL
jgi:hypothetical protein